nr:zinc-ribbon domain-containing protein [Lachnospiraceae bacterium]
MICPNCGREIGDNSFFCAFCGTSVNNDVPYYSFSI